MEAVDGVFSLVVPLYRSEGNLPRLFKALSDLASTIGPGFETVFVIDGSPDQCASILAHEAPAFQFPCRVVHLSRNFGSFAAITAGLQAGRGTCFGVLAADLQEPPELIVQFHRLLQSGSADVVLGERTLREDKSASSTIFWGVYRKFLNEDMPPGGVDVFGCNRMVRDQLLRCGEVESSLVSLLFWVGYRRAFVPYERVARQEGKSGWTLEKKIRYMLNTIFNFTDLPVRLLLICGFLGMSISIGMSVVIFLARLAGLIRVAGYTPIVLGIFFFGGVTTLGLGIVGQYAWLCLQNARNRPGYMVRSVDDFVPRSSDSALPASCSQ